VVTGISPSHGSVDGGTLISVSGVSFVSSSSAKCLFGSSSVPARVTSTSSLECVSPSGMAGMVEFGLSMDDQSSNSDGIIFSYVIPAVVHSISPRQGSTHGGINITITGEGFSFNSDISCYIGKVNVQAVYLSASTVRCTTPFHSEGDAIVSVSTDNVKAISTNELKFSFVLSSIITSISPSAGPLSGDSLITVSGSEFDVNSTNVFCNFGNTTVSAQVESATSLTCMSPVSTSDGYVSFSLTVGGNILPWSPYLYISSPIVADTSILEGPLVGGTVVVITGVNFNSNNQYLCKFGSISDEAVRISQTSLSCMSPPSGFIQVVNFTLSDSNYGVFYDSVFSFHNSPVISSFYISSKSSGVLMLQVDNIDSDKDWYCSIDYERVIGKIISNEWLLCDIFEIILNTKSIVSVRDEKSTFISNQISLFDSNNVSNSAPSTLYSELGSLSTLDSKLSINSNPSCNIQQVLDSCLAYRASYEEIGTCSSYSMSNCHSVSNTTMSAIIKSISSIASMNKLTNINPPRSLVDYTYKNDKIKISELMELSYVELNKFVNEKSEKLMINSCLINGKNSCVQNIAFDNDKMKNLSLVISNSQESNLGNNTQINSINFSLMVINSIEPSILNPSNGTWVKIEGKSFSNDTLCLLNNETITKSVYMTSSFMQCYVPEQAELKTLSAVLSLIDGSSRSINSMKIYFEKNFNYLSSDAIKNKYNSSDLAIYNEVKSNVCASAEGCIESSPLTSACTVADDSWIAMINSNAGLEGKYTFCEGRNSSLSDRDGTVIDYSTKSDNTFTGEVLIMTPISIDFNGTDNSLFFYGTNFKTNNHWCSKINNKISPCLINSQTLVVCHIDSNIPLGRHNIELLFDCSSSISNHSLQITPISTTPSSKLTSNNTSESIFDVWNNAPVVYSVTPTAGTISGGSLIKIHGFNLVGIDACRFSLDDEKYVMPVVSSSDDFISCESPLVSTIGKSSLDFSYKKHNWVTSSYTYVFFSQPVVQYMSPISLVGLEADIDIIGDQFPLNVPGLCKIEAAGGSTYLLHMIVLSNHHVKCMKKTYLNIDSLYIHNVSISFNGDDFIYANINYINNIVSTNTWMEKNKVIPLDQSKIKVKDLSSLSPRVPMKKCCTGQGFVNIFNSDIDSMTNYECLLNDVVIGKAIYSHGVGLLCPNPSLQPGIYTLVVQDVNIKESYKLPYAIELHCILHPQIFSGSIDLLSIEDAINEFKFSGINLLQSSNLILSVGNNRVKGAVDSSYSVNFQLSLLSPALYNISIVLDDKEVYSSSNVCLSVSALRDGGSISTFADSTTCNGDKLRYQTNHIEKELSTSVKDIISFYPRIGLDKGGTDVEIIADGINFFDYYYCYFGDKRVDAIIIDKNRLSCTSPKSVNKNVTLSVDSISGEKFCCGYFIYNAYITLLSVEPMAIQQQGGEFVYLKISNNLLLETNLYCYLGDEIVPAFFISKDYISCLSPSISSSHLDVSIGSQVERWSNVIIIPVIRSEYDSFILPIQGSIHGGTRVNISIPTELNYTKPIITFGGVTAKSLSTSRYMNSNSILVLSPEYSSSGRVDIGIYEETDYDMTVLKVATYIYERPSDIALVTPSSINQGKEVEILIQGSNFRDSTLLCCVLSDGSIIQAKWLSHTMITCVISSQVSVSANSIIVKVSNNNGYDLSEHSVSVDVRKENNVINVSPLIGFTSGGTTVKISFQEHYDAPIKCLFGSIIVSSFKINSLTYICSSPVQQAGDVRFQVKDDASLLYSGSFSYVNIPSIEKLSPDTILTGMNSNIVISGKGFIDGIIGRFRKPSGDSIENTCINSMNETEFTCSIVGPAEEEQLYLDISINNEDFINNFAAIRLIEPIKVLSTTPLYFYSQGGNEIELTVSGLKSGFVLSCQFHIENKKDIIIVPVTAKGSNKIICTVPPLPVGPAVHFILNQNGQSLLGPLSLHIQVDPHVSHVNPLNIIAGVMTPLYLTFSDKVSEVVSKCYIDGTGYEFRRTNDTYGVCYVYPVKAGNFSLLFSQSINVNNKDDIAININVQDPPNDLVLNGTNVIDFGPSAISITSPSCSIPTSNELYCTSPMMIIHTESVSNCEVVCVILPSQNAAVFHLELCSSEFCDVPLISRPIGIVKSVPIVAISPASGTALGGTSVVINGRGFRNDHSLTCLFGDIPATSTTWLSSTKVACISPSVSMPQVVPVKLYLRGLNISTSYVTFEYLQLLENFAVNTNKIISIGGTRIFTSSRTLPSKGPFMCRFEDKYTPASIVNETSVVCMSPQLDLSTVTFALSFNNGDISSVIDLSVEIPPTSLFIEPLTVQSSITTNNFTIIFSNELDDANIQCHSTEDKGIVNVDGVIVYCSFIKSFTKGYHNITISYGGVDFYDFQILSKSSNTIQSIFPSSGFLSTSTSLMLKSSNHELDSSSYKGCCFDNDIITPAMLVTSNDIQCTTPQLDLQKSTSIPIGISVSGGECEYTGFSFLFIVPPIALESSISTGPITGGSVIEITFMNSLPDKLFCKIGNNIFLGQVMHENVLTCITRDSYQAVVDIEISSNGIDFITTGFTFEFLPLIPETESASLDALAITPVIQFITPNEFPSGRQQIVKVWGSGFRLGSTCVIGTSYSLLTSFISESELDCTVPVHAPGVEKIVIINPLKQTSKSMEITFTSTPSLYFIPGGGVEPSFGPKSGETVITIFGSNLNKAGSDLYCLIGVDWAYAFDVTENSVKCIALPSEFSGKVDVKLANKNKDFIPGNALFEYIDDPLLFDSKPSKGSLGTELLVYGRGFLRINGLKCLIGDIEVETTVYSDTEAICTLPLMDEGEYSVTFQTNGQHLLRSGIKFYYFTQLGLTSLWPVTGPALKGGTLVTIYGTGFTNSIDTRCVFGDISSPAQVFSTEMVKCKSPSHRPGLVNVTLTIDGTSIHPENEQLQFYYTPDVSVDKISPEFGYTSGGYYVFVFGSNFINSTSLGCIFSDMKSRGVFISNNTIVCLAPSTIGLSKLAQPDSVAVEVTTNGYDYSSSRVMFSYSEPCDSGFFCPGMIRQLCPNGTFCPVNSRNFTLCNPGTFQPREGQSDCVTCPIGYICPDHGLTRPVVCPPGQICDNLGLRASDKSCPMGCYCLNGTKSDNLEVFMNDTTGIGGSSVWNKDYVSGVVTFNITAMNWDYVDWPFPALGKSRPFHPPEQLCDGLVCYPGSTSSLAEAPFPCPIGHYCRAGVGAQNPIIKNFSTPQRCFDGFFCARGSFSPEGSGPCPNGYFCPTQLNAIKCPRGHYCPGVGNRSPVECYPGTYNPYEAKANCTVCPTGHICPGWGTLLPELCPSGYVCMALGLSFPIVLCPQGYFCGPGTLTMDPSDSTLLRPKPCPAKVFCLGGVSSTDVMDWIPSQPYGFTHAQACAEGTYCKVGAFLASGSGLCFRGHYCPPDLSFPIKTPVGNFASLLGSVAPTLCFPGFYAPLEAQVDCLPCPSGHTCQSYGTYKPGVCPAGTFRSQIDSVTCRPCKTGTFSDEIAAVDISQCFPCPKGRICPIQGMFNLSDSSECPPGYVCGYGTDRGSQFSHKAPAGFWTAETTFTREQYNSTCLPGFYCARGTPNNRALNYKCSIGSFCPQSTPAGTSVEVKCPVYTTSLSGVSSIESCVIKDVDVCDKKRTDVTNPYEDVSYLEKFSYSVLDGSQTDKINFQSSSQSSSPTGEVIVIKKINPVNVSSSTAPFLNDTIEAFRACPQYGSGNGGDAVTIVGKNFRDTKLNFCKFRACLSANLGGSPRVCRNKINAPSGDKLPIAGEISDSTFMSKARYISPNRMECIVPEFLMERDIFRASVYVDDLREIKNSIQRYTCRYTQLNVVTKKVEIVNETFDSGNQVFPDSNYTREYLTDYNRAEHPHYNASTPDEMYHPPAEIMGNYSYIRECGDPDFDCMDMPGPGLEFFTALTFKCTVTDVYFNLCPDNPELGWMFNPCKSVEVAVEVSNDGEIYSGGEELRGTELTSTLIYSDVRPIKTIRNYKNFSLDATFAVYTYVYPEVWYTNPGIIEMEKKYCTLPRFSEEGDRPRENGWFLLQSNEAAHIQLDLRHIPGSMVYNEHYRFAVYIAPSRCTVELCTSSRVRLSPEEFLACRKPAIFPRWFEDDRVQKNVKNNITVFALDDLIFKIEVQILHGLYTAYEPLFKNSTTVVVVGPSRAITNRGLESFDTRRLSKYISYEERTIPMQFWFCAVLSLEMTLSISQPYNMPPLYQDYERGRALFMYNVSTEADMFTYVESKAEVDVGTKFWDPPASTNDESKEMLDAYFETFHNTVQSFGDSGAFTGYSFTFQNMLLPYLPYVSNCNTFDSYIPLWMLFESKECILPVDREKEWKRYKFPSLPDQDDIKFVHMWDIMAEPVADYCTYDLTCNFEEDLTGQDNTPRWFEAGGASLFQILRNPVDYYSYTGREQTGITMSDEGGAKTILDNFAVTSDNFIPVYYNNDAPEGCAEQCMPRQLTFNVQYFQVDNYVKKIVLASMDGEEYDFDIYNTEYTLSIDYHALDFFTLILQFAFDLPIFMALFVVIGLVTIGISAFSWIIVRLTTCLQNPPNLRIFGMLALIVPPPFAGTALGIIPIWFLTSCGYYFIYGMFFTDANSPSQVEGGLATFDHYFLSYMDTPSDENAGGGQGDAVPDDQTEGRHGRMGLVFFVIGFLCFSAGNKLYFPKKETKREREIAEMRTPLAKKDTIWQPNTWKQANFMFSSFICGTMMVLIVEFSFWGDFGTFIWVIIVALRAVGMVISVIIEYQLQDALLLAPVENAVGFTQGLVTFGSPDFLAFLLAYFVECGLAILERVYFDEAMEILYSIIGSIFGALFWVIKKILPRFIKVRLNIEDDVVDEIDTAKREVEGIASSGDSTESVEPILGSFASVSNDTMLLYYMPFFVYLFMQYRTPIGIPALYGIRQSDMLIYLVFQIFLIGFQPFVDILIHAHLELYHGWKLYEYLVYSRYRFLQRETRWKGMESSLDECIEEGMRKLDQMCFSSQYFLMLTVQTNGIVYVILGYQCWLRFGYSPFTDCGAIPLCGYMWAVFAIMEKVLLFIAQKINFWKIKHENTAWHLAQTGEDELDLPGWEDVKGASHEAYLMNQRITSDTFRFKFLNYNRAWLINQLPQLLTPRTLRRSRPYLINQLARIINARRDDISDDSDGDGRDKGFGPVALTAPSRNIIRWWLGKARRRLRLRSIVDPLIRRARGSECESCLSRKQLQIEYEVDVDSMAQMYDNVYPGDEEVDQVQWKSFWMNNQRYHTICLGCLTKRKELAAQNAMKGALDGTLLDDRQEDYPDWGPVYLTAASKAMLLNWYRKAQRMRAGKRGLGRRNKTVKAVSDDEGDIPAEWAKSLGVPSAATQALAIRWLRTARSRLLQKRGKGSSVREKDEEEVAKEEFRSGKKSKQIRK
jgi:hypothetical protein